MCFGGGNKTVKPEPTYPVRFAYNQPVPTPDETRRTQTANANTTGTFGSELGNTTPAPTGG